MLLTSGAPLLPLLIASLALHLEFSRLSNLALLFHVRLNSVAEPLCTAGGRLLNLGVLLLPAARRTHALVILVPNSWK